MLSNNLAEFHSACRNIVNNSSSPAVNYAVNYARYGLSICNEKEAKVQTLYILNNITHWRGDTARETRSTLKSLVKAWKNL